MPRTILLVAAVVSTLVVAPVPSQAEAADCTSGSLAGRVPVLLVHGFNSAPSTWGFGDQHPGVPSAVKQLCSATTHVEGFDYSAVHTEWVTDNRIGPALATAIADLAQRSRQAGGPGKVVIVAHSMGGLATRCALDPGCGHRSVRDDVAGVVTFGTPNHGTFLKSYGLSLPEGVLLRALSGQCVRRFEASLCEFVDAIATSPAAHAFTPGSGEEKRLPPWPQNLPTRAVAGKITLTTSLFGHVFQLGDVGDAVVGVESAHGDAGARARTVDCGTVGVAAFFKLQAVVDISCTHVREPRDPRFLAEAKQVIEAAPKGAVSHPGGTPSLTSATINPFVGTWFAHGGGLDISADMTGRQKISIGPCVVDNLPDTPYCNQVVSYRFTAMNAQGAVTGTVIKVGYETWEGGRPPAGFKPDGDLGFRVGLPVTLRKPKKDMVTVTAGPAAGLPFCQLNGASAAAGECGA
ncbi:alpha/beta fold hydrolase [Amycolatopsis sp. NPDC004625]|uniref:esterase/lipase family protein n=1 Tax=Amycolatopsis sp. NPDC004625 TaxID=3154670 RepID=UPI00339F7DEC